MKKSNQCIFAPTNNDLYFLFIFENERNVHFANTNFLFFVKYIAMVRRRSDRVLVIYF